MEINIVTLGGTLAYSLIVDPKKVTGHQLKHQVVEKLEDDVDPRRIQLYHESSAIGDDDVISDVVPQGERVTLQMVISSGPIQGDVDKFLELWDPSQSVGEVVQVLSDRGDVKATGGKATYFARPPKSFRGHFGKVYAVDFANDGTMFVSASQDASLGCWDLKNYAKKSKCAKINLQSSWVMTVGISPDGDCCASGGLDNHLSIHSISTQTLVAQLPSHDGYVSSCKFLSNSHVVTGSGDHTCGLWDVERNTQITSFTGHNSDVMCVSTPQFETGSSVFVSGSCDGTVKLWDKRSTCSCEQTVADLNPLCYQSKDVNGVSLSSGCQGVVLAVDDGTCRLFDVRKGIEVRCNGRPDVGTECNSVSFAGNARLVVSIYSDGCLSLEDALDGKLLSLQQAAHQNRISCLSVTANDDIVTGSWDSDLKVWDIFGKPAHGKSRERCLLS